MSFIRLVPEPGVEPGMRMPLLYRQLDGPSSTSGRVSDEYDPDNIALASPHCQVVLHAVPADHGILQRGALLADITLLPRSAPFPLALAENPHGTPSEGDMRRANTQN